MGKARVESWAVSDEFWARVEPLIPARVVTFKDESLRKRRAGAGRPAKPARQVFEAVMFVLRTGCQWNALDATGICSCSSAYRRFREWAEAGVFNAFWRTGLVKYDGLKGRDWSWLSMDGAMTKAPVAGSKKPGRIRRTGANKASSAAC